MLSASINIYTRRRQGGGLILVAAPLVAKQCTTAEMRLYKSVRPRAPLSRGRPRALYVKPHPPSLPRCMLPAWRAKIMISPNGGILV
jgi:hypothetical protein